MHLYDRSGLECRNSSVELNLSTVTVEHQFITGCAKVYTKVDRCDQYTLCR